MTSVKIFTVSHFPARNRFGFDRQSHEGGRTPSVMISCSRSRAAADCVSKPEAPARPFSVIAASKAPIAWSKSPAPACACATETTITGPVVTSTGAGVQLRIPGVTDDAGQAIEIAATVCSGESESRAARHRLTFAGCGDTEARSEP